MGLCVGAALLATVAKVPSTSAQAGATIDRSSWQMLIPDKIVGKLPAKPADLGGYFKDAQVPAEDAAWVAAPDPDEIKFDGTKPGFGGPDASRLVPQSDYPCGVSVDYTYFQTFITVPTGVNVTDFTVDFFKIDDAAKISIFNSKHPDGEVPNSVVEADEQATKTANLASELVPGEKNRVVITQMDFCSPGNNLGKATITLNGEDVPVETTTPEETTTEATTTTTPAAKPPKPITSTWGDVHIRTPDGLVYDFQKSGDLTLSRSSDGSVVVQARQAPYEVNPKVTTNQGAALSVAGDKLEFYVKPDRGYFVNDVATEVPTADVNLPKGGSILVDQGAAPGLTDLTILWPDGNTGARVVLHDNYIDIGVARLAGDLTYEGVLGNLDKDPSNDMQVKGGEQIATPASPEQLETFAQSWHVAEDESLFKDPAPAPATTEPATEVEPQLTLADLPAADTEKAKETCGDAGITEALALANCTYDVAATKDESFTQSATVFQEAAEELPADQRKNVAALEGAAPVKPVGEGLPEKSSSSKAPLFIGLGVLLVVLIGVVVFLATRRKDDGGGRPSATAPPAS